MGPFLVGSLIGHAVLLALLFSGGAFFGPKIIDLDQKPIQASLVRKGKPRDEKLLPRKEELPPPPKQSNEVALPIPGLEPEKAAPRQEGTNDGEGRKSRLFDAFSKTAAKTKYDELAGAEDGDPEGDSATAEGERYYGLLRAQIRRHYDVSNTIPEQERLQLRAQVVVRISRTGELESVKVHKSSGNELFDAAVVAAVKKASPFGPPPEHLRKTLSSGVILQFSP